MNSCTKLHRIQLRFENVLVSGGSVESKGEMYVCWVSLLSQPASANLSLKACLKRHGELLATSKNAFKNDFMSWALSKMPNKTRCFQQSYFAMYSKIHFSGALRRALLYLWVSGPC